MLLGKTKTVQRRITTIVIATIGVTLVAVALARLGALVTLWDWPPLPSSGFGVLCGVVGGAIVFFEMAIVLRKRWRRWRLGRTRLWMRLHIWMGLVCLPIILIHAGFGFGGPLATVTLVLFLLVTFSGVWGLIMQQWLPQKILADIPGETIASQIDRLGEYHADEARRIVTGLTTVPPEAEAVDPIIGGPLAVELEAFRDDVLLPYLQRGSHSRSPLTAPAEAERRFARLREAVPPEARNDLDRLQELANLRRRWDAQARLYFWLHNWLLVHLPLSVAMTALMVLHAVRALKYW
ncbi:hypothetical protein J8F10_19685 [Gemmata sp. G18]|uniref:Ferric oxidoreductase domain-containing protein n=1 Tax=Gemmata palustris TaxID=2822762 RepID=A0ABS5BUT4_9BACT|nr:hypothetical protein [Gemmata palustris]MBP3957475.1 hypothetical protein [Gemmata palustris]